MNVSVTHPLRELATLVAGVVVATLLLVTLATALVDLTVRHLPAGIERRIFGGLFQGDGASEQPASPRLARAASLLDRLAAHWPDDPYAHRLQLADAADPNAFALPGGTVVLTRGLLRAVESENELAFVLGHELGHFRHRDQLRGIGRGLVVQLAIAALLGRSGGAALPALVAGLSESRFAREQEREADHFALELVWREYGHVAGADRFFRRLPDAEAGLGLRAVGWAASHPVSALRIQDLRDEARRRGYATDGELVALPED